MLKLEEITQRVMQIGREGLEQRAADGIADAGEEWIDDGFVHREIWNGLPPRYSRAEIVEMLAAYPELFETDTSDFRIYRDVATAEGFFRRLVWQTVFNSVRDPLIEIAKSHGNEPLVPRG